MELRRVTEERDILKKGRRVLCQGVKAKVRLHAGASSGVHAARDVPGVEGEPGRLYYAWLQSPMSERAKEDERLLGLIKRQWPASGSVYGHRKVTCAIWGNAAAAIACIA